jgi:uncharacterized protein YecE (DUF72 family)
MKAAQIYIGCSAFNNAYWKGVFYPEDLPRTKWFDFYAQHFKTYELNATFYRAPTVKSLQSWYQKVPSDFVFSVKAPRNITHYKRFVDCKGEIDAFYAICKDGLNEKLGCVLFQLPPSFDYSQAHLALIVENLNPDFDNAIEFRHPSWWNAEVYETLHKNNITFCNVSYPKLPETTIATTDIGYIRLHGCPKLFYSGYTDAELEQWFLNIGQESKWDKIFFYFNNTADVHGIVNALYFQRMMLKCNKS